METGVCPICDGTTRVPYDGDARYKKVIAGYDEDTDTLPCRNCGGQYMFGRPKGTVALNREGEPCVHTYQSENAGRCLTRYTCIHCGDRHTIDSGD